MTEEQAAWAKAWVKAQSELPDIPKTKTANIPTKSGGSYSYEYADLADVLTIVRPVLNKNGLAVSQSLTGGPGTLEVTTRVYHTAGHCEEFGPLVLHTGNDAQSAGSAATYARRYSLAAVLGVAPDNDDDGRAAKRAPQFNLKQWTAVNMPEFEKWSKEQKVEAWERALIDGRPQSAEDAEAVVERMLIDYEERTADESSVV